MSLNAEVRPRKEAVRERLGRVLDGRYRLEACIGAGGTGAVYRARTIGAPRAVVPGEHLPPSRVAIKILHPHLVADVGRCDMFLKEARIAALVGHPGAVRVFDARMANDGTAYLVLEYLEGKSLQDALVGWGDLLVDEVVRVTRGILAILAAAHRNGVVHCDVKPENVFVLFDGEVKLLDFGVARITGEARRTGVAGTAAFMAPEQASGEWSIVDARADVWSVGATMANLLTGEELPASGEPSFPEDVPSPIADVIRRALARTPQERFADAGEMLDALTIAVAASGLPRSSRSNIALVEEDDTAPFTLLVPPYPVSLQALTTTTPILLLTKRAPAPSRTGRWLSSLRSPWVMAAVVVAAAGLLGAALAIAVTPEGILETNSRARMPLGASSTRTTSGEAPR